VPASGLASAASASLGVQNKLLPLRNNDASGSKTRCRVESLSLRHFDESSCAAARSHLVPSPSHSEATELNCPRYTTKQPLIMDNGMRAQSKQTETSADSRDDVPTSSGGTLCAAHAGCRCIAYNDAIVLDTDTAKSPCATRVKTHIGDNYACVVGA
jgi:hypothetical protein